MTPEIPDDLELNLDGVILTPDPELLRQAKQHMSGEIARKLGIHPPSRDDAVCENCGNPCDYDSEMCLCKKCELAGTPNGDECPVCENGTVEIVNGEVRCKGECGTVVKYNNEND